MRELLICFLCSGCILITYSQFHLYMRRRLSLEKRAIDFHPCRSMPGLHLTFLLVIACTLFFPCTECTYSLYEYCLQNGTKCGITNITYPFGVGSYGCGDPDFQLYCVQNNPVLSINRNNYSILAPEDFGISNTNHTIRIVDEKLLQQTCDPSNVYDDLQNNSHFHIAEQYAYNLTLLRCNQSPIFPSFTKLNCSSSWYYGSTLPTNWRIFCSLHVEVPVTLNGSNFLLGDPDLLYQGVQIEWNRNEIRDQNCAVCNQSNGICGYEFWDPQQPFICICEDALHLKHCRDGDVIHRGRSGGKSKKRFIIGGSIAGALLIAAGVLLLIAYKMNNRPPKRDMQHNLGLKAVNSRKSVSKVEEFLEDYAHEMPTRYSYFQLKRITNNFSFKLGEGGFGVVYRGTLSNGTLVAAKLLDQSRHGEKQFMNEVGTLGRIHHVHLVRLLGFCFEGSRSALLYEYMPNGSLEKFIFPGYKGTSHTLSWERLYAIALGAARGIAYLHTDCQKRIIHLDIKPHNVLLDENLSPKVSDFGLAKLYGRGDDHISVTAARGTPGYAAPEMWSRNFGPVTNKSDVYSFGMLLLEMVGGRKNIDVRLGASNSQLYFPEWIFHHLEGGELRRLRGISNGSVEDEGRAMRMSKVGLWCIQSKPSDRPSMSRVVQMLEGNGNDISNPPSPFDMPSTAPEAPLLSASTPTPVEYSSSDEIKESG